MSADGLSGDIEETRMLNDKEKIILLTARVGELEEQIEVIKKELKKVMRDGSYWTCDLADLKTLVNKELFV